MTQHAPLTGSQAVPGLQRAQLTDHGGDLVALPGTKPLKICLIPAAPGYERP
jgi:hypothetical protein